MGHFINNIIRNIMIVYLLDGACVFLTDHFITIIDLNYESGFELRNDFCMTACTHASCYLC